MMESNISSLTPQIGEFTGNLTDLFGNIAENDITPIKEEPKLKVEEAVQVEEPEVNVPEDAEVHLNEFETLLDSLYTEGLFPMETLPAEFQNKELSAEDTVKILAEALRKQPDLIDQAVEVERKKAFDEVYDSMSPELRQAFEFHINGGDNNETIDFLRGLVIKADIQQLDVETDAEEIVRQFNKANGKSKEEVDEIIGDLKQLNKLEKKAAELKPRLDKIAEEIATKQLEDQRMIEKMEEERKEDLSKRLDTFLQQGQIAGIPIDNTVKKVLKDIIVNQETEVTLKGKKVVVTAAESMMLFHKYSPKGNLETLSRGILMMIYPDMFEKYYEKKATEAETEKFVKEHKTSASAKSGSLFQKTTTPRAPKETGAGMRI